MADGFVPVNKYGVPLGGANLGIIHPRQKYRFRAVFLGLGGVRGDQLTANVMTATRPSHTFDPVDVHAYNTTAKIPSKPKWEPIEVTLRDDMNGAVVRAIGKQIQMQMNHFEQTSTSVGANYKFVMEIHSLDGTQGPEQDKWVLSGCFISGYTPPGGDYSSSDLNDIKINVAYDIATHVGGDEDPFPNLPSIGGGGPVA